MGARGGLNVIERTKMLLPLPEIEPQILIPPARRIVPLPTELRRGADKSLVFLIFLFATQLKNFFLDVLKKLEQ
jgi:hypothetical protein